MRPRLLMRGMAIRRLALWAGVLLVALAIAGVLFLDAAAARIAASAASKALGTEVRVRSVHVGLFDGVSTVGGIDVREPPGFPDGSMLTIGGVRVSVGLRGLFADSIEVDAIEIDGVHLQLTETGGHLNITTVTSTLAAGDIADAKASSAPSRSVVVRHLSMRDIRVTASSTMTTLAGRAVDVTIPDILIDDIGTKTTATQLASALSTDIIARLTTAVLAARINGLSSEVLSQLGSAAQTLGTAARSFIQDATPVLEDVGKKIGDALDGIFNPK